MGDKMSIPVLATTRYVEIGTYLGQFFIPGAGSLPNDVRVPCLVAKGDRLILVKNTPMRRSFSYVTSLTFTNLSPFIATLPYASDGVQSLPTRLYTNDGVEVSTNKWQFLTTGGEWLSLQILDSDFDPLAIYYLDYQTTSRDLLDPIPVITVQQLSAQAQVRQITAIGTAQDQQEFLEYTNFFGTFEVDNTVTNTGNTYRTTGISAVTEDITGTGTVTASPSANYSHSYSRLYTLECTAASGTPGTRLATLAWSATPVSYGNSALPSTPLNPAVQPRPEIELDEADPLSLSNQLLELGVVIDFTFGSANFMLGDLYYLQANGPGIIEVDPLLLNTNQYTEFTAVAPDLQTGSTGDMAISSSPSAYALTNYNLSFRLECLLTSGSAGTRQATFVWSGYTSHLISGSFTYDETVTGSDIQTLGSTGIKLTLTFGASNFVVGDMFSFRVLAPRIFYKGKENIRNTVLSVGTVTYGSNLATITGGYLTDTPEGRYGTWSAVSNSNNGRFEINDSLRFYIRNTYLSSLVNPVPGNGRLVAADKFSCQTRFLGALDFSLLEETTQLFSNPSEIATDVSGSITGTVGAKYLNLNNTPVELISLTRLSDDSPVLYTQLSGTSVLIITESGFGISDGDLQCIYRWTGAEPLPGQLYYLTAKYLRPDSFYNTPFLFLRRDDVLAFLAPSTVRNDLYIGADICWDYAINGLFIIQVKDTDDDGIYSKADFRTAVNAYLEDVRATDLIVLNYFNCLPDQLNVINKASDPFESHPSMTFIGCPIGTPVGSEYEQGTTVYYSRKTLAVYGNSPAHGSRVLVGPTRATRTIVLEDGSSTEVTLDGSFVAAALAALQASFTLPTATVLKQTLTSFNIMETFKKEENRQLGGNNVIFFYDEGNGVYRIMEDITTDPFSPDTLNMNQMTQKQFATKDIKRYLDDTIISLVFPSASAGISTIEGALLSRLAMLESSGFIGRYQDATGNEREIDTSDVVVFRDQADPTLFHVGYNYFLATTGKRIFGLYTVNLPGGFPTT